MRKVARYTSLDLVRHTVVVLATLLVLSCRSTPEPDPAPVTDISSYLGLAAEEASSVVQVLERSLLYSTIAEGFVGSSDLENGVLMAQAAFDLVALEPTNSAAVEVLIRVAPLFSASGDDNSAILSLTSAVQYVSSTADSTIQATLLPRIVESGIDSGEAARDILRVAVDEVYVIEDPVRRAEALIAIGDVFQARDTALSPVGLIHQASPAVRAGTDPIERADLFARLATLALVAGEPELSMRLAESAHRELEGVERYEPSPQLIRAVRLLSALGFGERMTILADRVRDPFTAIRLLIAANDGLGRSASIANLERADLILSTIVDPAEFVLAEIDIGHGWLSAGTTRIALEHAESANGRLAIEPTLYSTLELPTRLAQLYVEIGDVERARDLLLLAGDAYVRGAVAIETANALVRAGSLGLADDFYTIALIASDETTYLADALRAEIVPGYARTGSLRLAIRTIERIQDELVRARAVAAFAVIASDGTPPSPLIVADLASVLSRDS